VVGKHLPQIQHGLLNEGRQTLRHQRRQSTHIAHAQPLFELQKLSLVKAGGER